MKFSNEDSAPRAIHSENVTFFTFYFVKNVDQGLIKSFKNVYLLFSILDSSILLRKLWITQNTKHIKDQTKRNVYGGTNKYFEKGTDREKKAILWFERR